MRFLSASPRPRRSGEWTPERAVTFIVTLAATQSVTLAARAAAMSPKSAYALKSRDPEFAFAWSAAMRVSKGNKVEEEGPPIPSGHGNMSPSRSGRERAFAGLLASLREAPSLADPPPAQ